MTFGRRCRYPPPPCSLTRPFPTLRIAADRTDVEAFCFEDFELSGYEPHKKIAMKMAV